MVSEGGRAIKHSDFQDKHPALFSDSTHLSFIGNDILLNSSQGVFETFFKLSKRKSVSSGVMQPSKSLTLARRWVLCKGFMAVSGLVGQAFGWPAHQGHSLARLLELFVVSCQLQLTV